MTKAAIIYIDYQFLKDFIADKPTIDDVFDLESKRLENWRHLFRVITEFSIIKSDRSFLPEVETGTDFSSSYIKSLIFKIYDGIDQDSDIIEPDYFEAINLDDFCNSPKSIFIFHSKYLSLPVNESNAGIISGDYAYIKDNWDRIGKSTTFKIGVGLTSSFTSWNNLKDYKLPVNSIIIADPYILYDKELFHENLFRILRCLLPKRCLKTQVEIMIITAFHDKKFTLKSLKEEIERHVRSNLGLVKFELTLIKAVESYESYSNGKKETIERSLFHDRTILTNYQILRSGNSFSSFFKNGVISLKKATKLEIISNVEEKTVNFKKISCYEDNDIYVEEMKAIIDNSKIECEGIKHNRLLNTIHLNP